MELSQHSPNLNITKLLRCIAAPKGAANVTSAADLMAHLQVAPDVSVSLRRRGRKLITPSSSFVLPPCTQSSVGFNPNSDPRFGRRAVGLQTVLSEYLVLNEADNVYLYLALSNSSGAASSANIDRQQAADALMTVLRYSRSAVDPS
jgi:hypothetical protein